MQKLVLHEIHKAHQANFIKTDGLLLPDSYGDPLSEIDKVKNRIALLDRSYLGKVRLKGEDAVDLLNRISTNDMSQLIAGTVCDSVFTTPKGRIVDYCRILRLEEELLIISSYLNADHLIDWINRFIILEDVEISDVTTEFVWLTLIGPKSLPFVQMLSKNKAVLNDAQVWIEHGPNMFPALLNQNFMMPAYNFCFPAEEAGETFAWLISELYAEGGCLIGNNAFQVVRIESGMPDWGTELTEDYNPHEARLISAVSFTKGCYTGQEVIARLDTYDKVQKYLMIIDMGERISKPPPHDIYIDEDKVGVLTSFTRNPLNNKNIGLGYIKKNFTVNDIDLRVDVVQDEKRIPSVIRKPPTAM